MKSLSVTLKFIAAAAIALACLGTFPALADSTSDPVTIEKNRILIPGTNISESDQRAMNAILAQYDKSLYKLKGYVKGKPGKQQGTLKDAAIDKATAARAAIHAKDPQFTGSTLQIGATANQDIARKPGSTANQDWTTKPGSSVNQDWTIRAGSAANQELVKRLTPILRKYSKIQSTR
ncbi:MAG: hypothetical protein V7609_2341 [Verrucomicrobiota bacterium]